MNRSTETDDLEKALLVVIRQCTLIDDVRGDRPEMRKRGKALVELARTVVLRIEQQ